MSERRKTTDSRLYHLSRRQLGLLAVAFTATCSIVFFLGMLVGQRVEERKLLQRAGDGPVVRVPLSQLHSGSGASAGTGSDQELTFYDTLTKNPTRSGSEASQQDLIVPSKPEMRTAAQQKVAEPVKRAGLLSGRGPTIWSIQVTAFSDRGAAEVLANKLGGKGYQAYVASAVVKGRTWHRVRVGRFADQREAKAMLETLQKREKFTEAILVKGDR